MLLSSFAVFNSNDYNTQNTSLEEVTEQSFSSYDPMGIESVSFVANHPFDKVINGGNGTFFGIYETSTSITIGGITIDPPQTSNTNKEHCIISSFKEEKILWTRVFAQNGTNALYDNTCSDIVFYDYGIRVIGIIEHNGYGVGGSIGSSHLYWNGTSFKNHTGDGIYFLDISSNGTFNDLKVISGRSIGTGNAEYCANPIIRSVAHTSSNSTYLITYINGASSYGGSSSYGNRCNWNPSGDTSNSYITTFASTTQMPILWKLDTNGTASSWITSIGYTSGVGNNPVYLMEPLPEEDGVILVGASAPYVSSSSLYCTTSCTLHSPSSGSGTNVPFKTNRAQPYISRIYSSGNVSSTSITIDDNNNYYREESVDISSVSLYDEDTILISGYYTQDSRSSTGNATWNGINLAQHGKTWTLKLNNLNSTVNMTLFAQHELTNERVFKINDYDMVYGSNDYTFQTNSTTIVTDLFEIFYISNQSVKWSIDGLFSSYSLISVDASPNSLVFVMRCTSGCAFSWNGNWYNPPVNGIIFATLSRDYDEDNVPDQLDTDDDGDSILDVNDLCSKGVIFISSSQTDRDSDGCKDSSEDIDDDGDGKNDTSDSCATGTMYWTRNSTTDYDDDGCNDASEDFNDDNDNYQDFEDMCPRLVGNSTYSNEKGCPDDDGDGRANMTDPFPNDSSEWKDTDNDGHGDNGDEFPLDATQNADTDSDGYGDNSNGNSGDACPSVAGNSTLDRLGCVDSDGDGYSNLGDAFDNNPTQYLDSDGDGYGNNQSTGATQSDAFPSDGTQWVDADGDGHGDNKYGSQGDHFPNDATRWQDSDEDGYANPDDAFDNDATQWNDTDGDGYGDNSNGNNADLFPNDSSEWYDADGDGYGDNSDEFRYDGSQWNDTDGDGYGDNPNGSRADLFPNDSTEWYDTDGDGYGNNAQDSFPSDGTQWNDTDDDGYGDNPNGTNADMFPGDEDRWSDSDGDTYSDQENDDAFPNDSSQWNDTDGDGYGDNPNGSNADLFPNNSSEWYDADGDGVGDNSDDFQYDGSQSTDSDGDGYGDNPNGSNADQFPNDATEWYDTDGDGYGNNAQDSFPSDGTQWNDTDADGYGDNPNGTNADRLSRT